jgi:hypothetical protein
VHLFHFSTQQSLCIFSIGASINKDIENHVVAMVQTTSVTMYDDTPLDLSSDMGVKEPTNCQVCNRMQETCSLTPKK